MSISRIYRVSQITKIERNSDGWALFILDTGANLLVPDKSHGHELGDIVLAFPSYSSGRPHREIIFDAISWHSKYFVYSLTLNKWMLKNIHRNWTTSSFGLKEVEIGQYYELEIG